MKDFKDNIGRHANFDDHRYWTFVRDSKIPHGSLGDRKWTADGVVFIVLSILIALALFIVNVSAS